MAKKREIPEINAGSMADIAFLLLIFFLVTTTMDKDKGIIRNMPQKLENNVQDVIVKQRNILNVMANNDDLLLVRNEYVDVEDVYDLAREFYEMNKGGVERDGNFPMWNFFDLNTVKQRISEYENQLKESPDNKFVEKELESWKDREEIIMNVPDIRAKGGYYEISKFATISLSNQIQTSYGLYFQVQDQLQRAIDDMRNETSKELFDGKIFTEIDAKDDRAKTEDDLLLIKTVKQIVPQRIAEAKIKN
ncbi:MAG: biopolymer transporter ExbD [Crocinitomicaceae bacterium]|nr:biopolymer transporter ExbD [Crocinitomicaceae bacterium]